MTFAQFSLARQLLVEERLGTAVRAAYAEEDAAFRKSVEGVRVIR